MSRIFSNWFTKINMVVYAVNFFMLFVTIIMLLGATNNLLVLMLPGMFLAWLICLVYPDFYNVVGQMFNWQNVSQPDADLCMQQMNAIVANIGGQDYSYLNPCLPIALVCALLCFLLCIVCMCFQPKLLKIVQSPMDWYKKHKLSTYIYSGFGLVYAISMSIGAFSVIFARHPITGGLLTLAWAFAVCAIAILAGVVVLNVERFVSVQTFNTLTVDEQIDLCEKQSKYMNKRQRKKQIKRLKGNARYMDKDTRRKRRRQKEAKTISLDEAKPLE